MTTVACDVCGERYAVGRSAFGRSQKCKMCLIPFEVGSYTVTPDEDETKGDDEPELSEFEVLKRTIGTGLTTLALIGCFGWMASLPFRNPRAVPARVAVTAPTVVPVPNTRPIQPRPAPATPSFTPSNITPPHRTEPSATSMPSAADSRFDNLQLPYAPNAAPKDGDATANASPLNPPSKDLANNGPPSKLASGMRVQVRLDDQLRPAVVTRVLTEGMVEVFFLGERKSGAKFETVKAEQIELADDTPTESRAPIAASPPPAAEPLVLRIGLKVRVRQDDVVRVAMVSRVLGDGTVEVHYLNVGIGSTPVEVVKVEQVERFDTTATGTKPSAVPAERSKSPILMTPSLGGAPNYDGPGKVLSSGRKIASLAPLKKGLIVQVAWGGSGSWFPADVVRINANRTVRVHYRGWSDSFDEDVTLDKIQLAHDGINRQ